MTIDGELEGDPVPLTVGVGMRWAAFSVDGRNLAYSRGRPVANVWRVPILKDRAAGWEEAEQLTFDEAEVQSVDLLPGSEQLVISSDRGGSRDLWLSTLNGKDMRPLTTDPASDAAPRVSTDGKHVAFYSSRDGNLDIWVLPIEGGPAVQLTRHPLSDMFPAWSRDGLTIAFYGGRDDGVQLFVVPATGGEARQLTTGAGSRYFPQWSPDGSWLYYASGEGPGRYQIFRMPAAGGNPEQVTTSSAFYYRWSHDGMRMYFPGTSRGSHDLWERTLADGHERGLTRFIGKPGRPGGVSLAASETHLYFTWRHDLGDIWVIDVVPEEER